MGAYHRCASPDGSLAATAPLVRSPTDATIEPGRLSSWCAQPEAGYGAGDLIVERYRLAQPIAEGGMGTVWVADDLVLGIRVALKLLRPELLDTSAAERMLREARAAARLRHRAIVRVTDYGLARQRHPFLVMELLQGPSLAEHLRRHGPMTPEQAVRVLVPIGEGLALAHSCRIIHRDIKPDNIMLALDQDGGTQPKLIDFGLAKTTGIALEGNLTQLGVLLGSPAYMSPEQARGESDLDGRTDVWSLCVVLYEMVTGQVPFRASNYNAQIFAILEQAPAEVPHLDPLLQAILDRGLRKNRQERWSSIQQLTDALRQWLELSAVPRRSLATVPPAITTRRGTRARRWSLLAAAASVLLLTGVAQWQARSQQQIGRAHV